MTEDDIKFADGARAFFEIENSEGFQFFLTVIRATFNVEDLFTGLQATQGMTLGETYAKADGLHDAASRIIALPQDIRNKAMLVANEHIKK